MPVERGHERPGANITDGGTPRAVATKPASMLYKKMEYVWVFYVTISGGPSAGEF